MYYYAMRTLHELSAPGGLRATLDYTHTAFSDAVYSVAAAVQIHVGEHANRIADNWDNMSSWSRAVHSVGKLTVGVAAGTIASRLGGGVVHGLDEALHTLPSSGGGGSSLSAVHTATPGEHMSLAAVTETKIAAANVHDRGIDLPANTSKAPDTVNLGRYNGKTGDGTLWRWGIKMADELGYGHLDTDEKEAMAAKMLDANNKSWDSARDLQPGYDVHFPTQSEAIRVLEDAGATKTHAADRPPVHTTLPPPAGNNLPPPTGNTGQQTLPPLDACPPPIPPGWYPLQASFWGIHSTAYPFRSYWDCQLTAPDIGNTLLIGLALIGGGIGQVVLDRNRTGLRPLYDTGRRYTFRRQAAAEPPVPRTTSQAPVAQHPVIDPPVATMNHTERRHHPIRNAAVAAGALAASRALLGKIGRRDRRKNKSKKPVA